MRAAAAATGGGWTGDGSCRRVEGRSRQRCVMYQQGSSGFWTATGGGQGQEETQSLDEWKRGDAARVAVNAMQEGRRAVSGRWIAVWT